MSRVFSWLFVLLLACTALTVQAQTIDINSASAQELDSVKGIGPKTADAIIKYRTEHGPFQSVEDLVQVPGIGPKSLSKMKDQLSVGGATGLSTGTKMPATTGAKTGMGVPGGVPPGMGMGSGTAPGRTTTPGLPPSGTPMPTTRPQQQ